ncbi:MAG: 1,4-beta-xylanase [Verrucomicrobiota bacterium]|nr:1,4-beta-xylanase [Verrucomicrobiota bacterium]
MFSKPPQRWSEDKAWSWYDANPWFIGANFLPSTAINQLEMFQCDTYARDRGVLIRELDWAQALGFNSLRVFLHDLLWEHEREDFFRTLDDFLQLCDERGIRPLLVFFDDCHRPEPHYGLQPETVLGYHNPGWAQSPGVPTLIDEWRWSRLERYVKAVLNNYGRDSRVLCWDLFNEPLNAGFDNNKHKLPYSLRLLKHIWHWARECNPEQPLTTCVWSHPDPTKVHAEESLNESEQLMLEAQRYSLEASDIISFHNYGNTESLAARINSLKPLSRPLICTEYMARTAGSTFQSSLPLLHKEKVAAYNWGFVWGKSQTIHPWYSPIGAPEPAVWFHDIYRPDGTPFDEEETALITRLTHKSVQSVGC